MRMILAIAMALSAGTAGFAAEPATVDFNDLADPAARAFVDPYLEMGPERLNDLRTVVRLGARLAEAELSPEDRQRLEVRRSDAEAALAVSGFDIAALLAQRWTVAQKRREAQIATNPLLEGAAVRLEGYLIPAGTGPDGRGIGYLVPVVGMCSHIPAPPPNELVRLYFEPERGTGSIYLPVSVTGTLRAEASDETIHLLDGMVRMQSLWRLDADTLVAEGPVPTARNTIVAQDPLEALPAEEINQTRSSSIGARKK
ncbi:DUF3299 domain-containing protein [Pseudoruegeria sp. M32A2M]|nr:DUF3299 domain-containing protein [Pseudoruegeria sp. M32A2M]